MAEVDKEDKIEGRKPCSFEWIAIYLVNLWVAQGCRPPWLPPPTLTFLGGSQEGASESQHQRRGGREQGSSRESREQGPAGASKEKGGSQGGATKTGAGGAPVQRPGRISNAMLL